MIKTIRAQLLLVNTAMLVLAFSVISVYLVAKNTAALRMTLQNEVESFATLATPPIGNAYSLYGESGTGRIKDTIKSYLDANDSIVNAEVYDVSGKQLFSYTGARDFKPTTKQASTFTTSLDIHNNRLEHVIAPYFGASGVHSYSVVYTVSNEQIDSLVRSQTLSLLVFSVAALILTTIVTYAAINRIILRPIRDVSRQAAAISAGNLEQQISAGGNNEIAALGQAVNTMAESLKANIAKLQEIDKVKSEFMAITSHNLRTPLTIISGYLENADLFKTVDELKTAMKRIGESVQRLGGFAEDVLTISRFELGEADSVRERVNIGSFMTKIASETKATVELRELTFTSQIETDVEVLVSPPHVRSAVWNIIDNAIKFTPKGGTITLRVQSDGTAAHISVSDTGIGISDAELPKLFTKFHRGTSVETYDFEGTGIGLYASKIIIEEQGGTITAESQKDKGSTFTISLPIAPARAEAYTHQQEDKPNA